MIHASFNDKNFDNIESNLNDDFNEWFVDNNLSIHIPHDKMKSFHLVLKEN